MEKMKFETNDLSSLYTKKLETVLPEVVTEIKDENGNLKKAVDFEKLKQLLTEADEIIEADDERYEFTWVGKKEAIREANKPIKKTLRPCEKESKDWDNTENLYIEGDNLEALKLLQESYLNSIKMIYIDPPYNTGNDFIYKDDFKMTSDEYQEKIGQLDEEGNRLFKNTDTNGRFHSDWCSMIYSRLMLARNLLSDDGVIFISIDDNEQQNMKNICNEIFGEHNFIAQVIWQRAFSPINLKKHFSESHDYILCYAKNLSNVECNGLPRSDEANSRYNNPDNDLRGVWTSSDLSVGPAVEKNIYEIITPSGRKVMPPSGYSWRLSRERFEEYVKDNRIWFGKDGNNVPRIKRFLSEIDNKGITPMTIWKCDEVGHSQSAKQDLKKLFDGKSYFDYPKSVELLKRCIQLYSKEDSIILDFFSGSATTAHAVMDLNIEDGGNRKFIMVQLPEKTDKKSEAYKNEYETICEIGRERIKRAGEKIKEENSNKEGIDNLDIGFRVLKIDSINMKDVYYSPNEHNQIRISDLESNIKEDRTDLDLLFGCLIEWGIPLNRAYESKNIAGTTVHIYNEGDLIACFDDNISQEAIKEIAKLEPLRVVFKDSSFKTSAQKINVEEIFKLLSPETSLRVI